MPTGIVASTFPVLVSMTEAVLASSLETYSRVPSGLTAKASGSVPAVKRAFTVREEASTTAMTLSWPSAT